MNLPGLFDRAMQLHQAGQIKEAVALYLEVLPEQQGDDHLLYLLGTAYLQIGQLNEALEFLRKSIVLSPENASAHNNLGNALKDLKRADEALASYDRAIALAPGLADAHYNRGIALKDLQRLEEALASYDQAIALQPGFADAFNNRGSVLQKLRRPAEALTTYNQAIALKPGLADAHNNRGNALHELQRLDDALASYKQAIALKPDFASAHHNRGIVLTALQRHEEALAHYDKAFALQPDMDYLLGSKLHTQMQLCDWDNFTGNLGLLRAKIENSESPSVPFVVHGLLDAPDLQRKCAENFIKSKHLAEIRRHPNRSRADPGKIKVAYFSSDFGNHPVTHLLAGLFEAHDRDRFEISAFSLEDRDVDEWRQRVIHGVDRFIQVGSRSDQEIAGLSQELGIDIAVDLNGHTQGSRPGIFSYRAAPVQASYIGFLGTMGAPFYDYLMADRILVPEAKRGLYTEKLVYLPSYQCNDDKLEIADTVFARSDFGLPEGCFVFCSFNKSYKITPPVFDSWMRVLHQVKDSVLWVYVDSETAKANLKKEALARGMSSDRLIFASKVSLKEHLARQKLADLFLDTFPYNAGATASHVLRVGLPMVTLAGQSFASRYGASLLHAVDLPELVAHTFEQYEALAIELATHSDRLATVKEKLSDHLKTSRLFDAGCFARSMESAFLEMHRRLQEGLPPDHIDVSQPAASRLFS